MNELDRACLRIMSKCMTGNVTDAQAIRNVKSAGTNGSPVDQKAARILCLFFDRMMKDGGQGSGNFGHKGRPGQIGGSGGGGGSSSESGYHGGAQKRTAVSHKIVSPDTAISEIQSCAKKAVESGAKSYDEVKTQMFSETENSDLPQICPSTDFDSVESDYPIMYRGFHNAKYADQFLNGDLYVGEGFAGSGTNVAFDPKDSVTYGGAIVLEMKLAKGAKVISTDDLLSVFAPIRDKLADDSGSDAQKFASWLASDPGCVAAALGYDAIYDDLHKWINVLNRSQVVVKEDRT